MKTKHEDLGDVITGQVIGAAIAVHRQFGPGLDETDYERALHLELTALGIEHECQVPMPIYYKETMLDCGYRMDLVLPGRLLLELKAVDKLHPIHEAQLLTYLRLSKLPLGLLMNFNVLMLRKGILRRASTAAARRPKAAISEVGKDFDTVSREVTDAAVEVQNHLGPGLLRSAYEACLTHELVLRGLNVERNQPVNLLYREQWIPSSKNIPMVVEGKLMVACHCIAQMAPIHLSRARSLLRAAGVESGLCINFHDTHLAGSIRRIQTHSSGTSAFF